jgi:DNA polymerase IV
MELWSGVAVLGKRDESSRLPPELETLHSLKLVRGVLASHLDERTISLPAISVSNLESHAIVQLELPHGLPDEGCRPGTQKGVARARADRAVDAIRKRFGANAVDYGSASRGGRSVPDEFRRLAEKEL